MSHWSMCMIIAIVSINVSYFTVWYARLAHLLLKCGILNPENFLRARKTFLENFHLNISDFEYVFVEQILLNIIQNAQNV